MKKSLLFLSIVVLVFGSLIGCTSTDTGTGGEVLNPPANETPAPKEPASPPEETLVTEYPVTITDDSGKEVTIKAEPKRIISITPSNTEDLIAIGCLDNLVGVSSYAPEAAKEKAEVVFEDLNSPNAEQIVNLNADLIVLGSHNNAIQEVITDLGLDVAVVVYDPQSVEAVYETIHDLGVITNKEINALNVNAKIKEKELAIAEKIAQIPAEEKVRVFVAVFDNLYTSGVGTYMNDLITLAGGANIVTEEGYFEYSEEKLVEKDPQVIAVTYGYYNTSAVDDLLTKEGWESLSAIKDKKVVEVNNDIVNRPGPFMMDAVEEFAKAFYPDLF